jgi:hypothetical protein
MNHRTKFQHQYLATLLSILSKKSVYYSHFYYSWQEIVHVDGRGYVSELLLPMGLFFMPRR